MLDVRSGNTIESAVILIDGERITAAGSKLAIPAGAQVIDLGDKTVLPGLIDMHTHLTGDPQDAGYAVVAKSVPRMTMTGAKNARLTLQAGFTTVRNLGAEGYSDIGLRDAINDGEMPGPRIAAPVRPWASRAAIATTPCMRPNTRAPRWAWPTAPKKRSRSRAASSNTAPT
jgi:imidazolonepropionase-like amidohydrolase